MALTERKEIGVVNVLPNGVFQVREDTVIERDGVEISRTHHRTVVEPGAPVTDPLLQKLAAGFWTPELIEARAVERQEASDRLLDQVNPRRLRAPINAGDPPREQER